MIPELLFFTMRHVNDLSILLFHVSIQKYVMSLLNLSNVYKCFKQIFAYYAIFNN
jgi:hypothetical protein